MVNTFNFSNLYYLIEQNSLKYQKSTTFRCKDIGIIKSEIVAQTPRPPPLITRNILKLSLSGPGSKNQWNYSIPSEPSDSMIAKIRYSK